MFMKEDLLDIKLYNIFEDESKDFEKKYQSLKELAMRYQTDYMWLKQRYIWLKYMNIDPNLVHLKENHLLVYEIFDKYSQMLNENNIEYYYSGDILAYLLVGKELERNHHDLDVFINMDDLEKLEDVCMKYGFSFERKMVMCDDCSKRVMLKMYYKDFLDFQITVSMYVREKDSFIQKDYFVNEENDKLVEYRFISPEIFNLSFSNVPHFHNNIRYYAISLEALYLCKGGNSPKDIYDFNIFKDYVDKEKLQVLAEAYKENNSNFIVSADKDGFSDFIFKDKNKVFKYDNL